MDVQCVHLMHPLKAPDGAPEWSSWYDFKFELEYNAIHHFKEELLSCQNI